VTAPDIGVAVLKRPRRDARAVGIQDPDSRKFRGDKDRARLSQQLWTRRVTWRDPYKHWVLCYLLGFEDFRRGGMGKSGSLHFAASPPRSGWHALAWTIVVMTDFSW